MARARSAVLAAVLLILALGATALAAPGAPLAGIGALAVPSWPPSAGLVIAEVVTGGTSASDEYVELTNASPAAIDVAGLEVAYVTSTGGTVTRKATWPTTTLLEPGRHLLIANSTGVFGAQADATYSGGFAATGGALVVRPIGGQPIDAVGWGDATSVFIEGSAVLAPAAGSSIERRPGGAGGNGSDTNDNASDFIVNGAPVAQNLAALPVPVPGPSASAGPTPSPTLAPTASPTAAPTPTPLPTATPTPTPTASPTPTPTPTHTTAPTASPSPAPTPSPTPVATPTPTPAPTASPTTPPSAAPTTSPTPVATPTPTPTPSPTAMPTPTPAITIAAARGLADGAEATIEGILTTNLGALESARTGFIQDETGGIAIYLDAAFGDPIPAGMHARITGIVDSRFAQRTIRVDRTDVMVFGADAIPAPRIVSTREASEPFEGLRLEVAGSVTEAPGPLSDGLGITIDDGSGPVRIVAGPDALGVATPVKGSIVVARGPLGQRDSSGTGVEGYRLNATLGGELEVSPSATPTPTTSPIVAPSPTATPSTAPSPEPSPSASATAAPTPSPSATPTPTPSPTPTSSPTPSPSPVPSATPNPQALTVGTARLAAIGSTVTVRGVVIAEAGRLGTPAVLVIGDSTGGLPVRLPDGVTAPARGTLLEVRGVLADPYGQIEIRPPKGALTVVGTGALPSPSALAAAAVGESSEGRLVRVAGTVAAAATKSTSNDITFTITGSDGATLKILADASAGIDPSTLRKGVVATFTGISGQRATRKGALDGYRVWLRDRADVNVTAQPTPTSKPSAKPSAKPGAGPSAPGVISVKVALLRGGQRVTVEGVLDSGTGLLDASGRRSIVEDGTAAIEVYLAAPDTAMRLGTRVRVTGTVGKAWGAPRLKVEAAHVLGSLQPTASVVHTAPTAAVEWRLVKLQGTVVDVHRNGDRWSAELQIGGGAKVPVSGLAGSGIASTALVEGREATITGIVKRPYPTATDRRFALVPRRVADIVLGKPVPTPGASTSPLAGSGTTSATSTGVPIPGTSGFGVVEAVADVDLRDIGAHLGQRVRVGGLVTGVGPDGVRLDDGTSGALLVLEGDAADLLTALEPGDALNATGTPDQRDETVLLVAGAADVELVGDLGGTESGAPDQIGLAAIVETGTPNAAAQPVTSPAASRAGTDPITVGIAIVVVTLTLVATAALAARRQRTRRRLRTRIAARLEALRRTAGPAATGAERAPQPPIGAGSGAELDANVRGPA
jgi:uncharacterized protein YdeI (BOF family)